MLLSCKSKVFVRQDDLFLKDDGFGDVHSYNLADKKLEFLLILKAKVHFDDFKRPLGNRSNISLFKFLWLINPNLEWVKSSNKQ